MEVTGASTANNANIVQATLNNGDHQKFVFTHLGNGTYKIIAKHSGLSMDVKAFDKGGTTNQKFILIPTGDGYYKIVAGHSGKLVEVAAFSTANGGNIQQWESVSIQFHLEF